MMSVFGECGKNAEGEGMKRIVCFFFHRRRWIKVWPEIVCGKCKIKWNMIESTIIQLFD